MANKLYAGNLSYRTEEETLRTLFSQFGEIESVAIIKDRETQQSKGFGFITFADGSQLDKAIAALNGKEVDGRKIRVSVAEERPPRQQGGEGRGGFRGGFHGGQRDGSRGGWNEGRSW